MASAREDGEAFLVSLISKRVLIASAAWTRANSWIWPITRGRPPGLPLWSFLKRWAAGGYVLPAPDMPLFVPCSQGHLCSPCELCPATSQGKSRAGYLRTGPSRFVHCYRRVLKAATLVVFNLNYSRLARRSSKRRSLRCGAMTPRSREARRRDQRGDVLAANLYDEDFKTRL